jgi:hypothetical protein
VNNALAPLNIALTRRSTLENMRSELAAAKAQLHAGELELFRAKEIAAQVHAVLDGKPAGFDSASLEAGIAPVRAGLSDLRQELLRHQIASRWSIVDAIERLSGTAPEFRTCPLCGVSDKATTFRPYVSSCIFGGGLLERHQCPNCDVIFGADKMLRLSPNELGSDYEWHYKVYQEGDSTEAELRAFHSLKPRRDGVYVNYGAGSWSRTVPLLREQGWNVFAYEPHGSAAATGGEWLISSEAQMHGHQFDGIFSNNVLEHLRRPADDLRRMKGWLKPGATMAHATPCFEYLYEYTRFHLFFFPGRSRELLADRAGLRIENFEVDGEFMNCVFSPQE